MTDAKSQRLLEFPQLRDRLAALTAFPPSRRLADALEPSSDPVLIARGLDETDQTRELLAERTSAGIGSARDIGPGVERAARGGRLDPTDLVAIMVTLEAASRLADVLQSDRRPLLAELGRGIRPLPALRARLEQSLDPAGTLLDGASPALGGLRRGVRIAYERLRSRLETMVHGSELSGALQESLITLRNGRYVIPVRADARSRVKGIVHDQSASGQTLFVEPLVAVEMGNAWREAQLAVEAEEERILDELSMLVAAQTEPLRETLAALAAFDFWAAKARLASEFDAVRAETSPASEVELFGARHPGLSGRVVPIDIRLGGEYTALVITGPNTGGKTVALRTLGLLALMHQAGLHVPAQPGSRLPIFRDVFADIGDEQSIAQSLSTFSGHLRSIVRIVEQAGPDTLVLLDELGAGTDPTEGSALAQALLDHFIRAGALVVATTHYAELKAYAHNTPAARNASVDFDLETLSPTYHLSIGLPGTSQAFAIAERLGLPEPLVADARSRLSRAQQEFEATLAAIKATEATAADVLERVGAAEERARTAQRDAEIERARARRERDDAFMSAREEAERALAGVREEIRAVRASLERETLTQAGLDDLARRLDERLEALPATGGGGPATAPRESQEPLRVGAHARAASGGWEGRIAAIDQDGEQATLEAGEMRVIVPLADLVPAPAPVALGAGNKPGRGSSGRRGEFGTELAAQGGPAQASRRVSRAPVRGVASTLDLRGARVDEALELLDRFLDQAVVAGIPQVTVVHGHGTGALRDAVRSALGEHAQVREWRPGERGEGGDGASIVLL